MTELVVLTPGSDEVTRRHPGRVVPFDPSGFRDKCGVVGVYGNPEAGHLAYLALHALQHRGQESAGIVALRRAPGPDGAAVDTVTRRLGAGLVSDVFRAADLEALRGRAAVGHVRYATAGTPDLADGQPLLARTHAGHLAVAHNGNLVNAGALRTALEKQGALFQTSSDTEVISHLVATSDRSLPLAERLKAALAQVRGAYALCVIGDGALYGVRDPSGVRPLVLGKLDEGYVLASETCAFDLIGATFVRSIEPGEMLVIDADGMRSERVPNPAAQPVAQCVFEQVYFARPDSTVFGAPVHAARMKLGAQLAKEQPAEADVVIPVPDSGVVAAMGYARALGLPFEMGFVRNHYVGRTFIEPEQRIRNFGVKLKLNPVRHVVEGKRVVVVDDSIVRGTTSRKIVTMLKNAGAKEVHMRISAPPTRHPCFYGIATPTREELIAHTHDHAAITASINADSLGYLSIEGMRASVTGATADGPAAPEAQTARAGLCDACFSGHYPLTHD